MDYWIGELGILDDIKVTKERIQELIAKSKTKRPYHTLEKYIRRSKYAKEGKSPKRRRTSPGKSVKEEEQEESNSEEEEEENDTLQTQE